VVSKKISLRNSEFSGIRILFISEDGQRAQEYEAKSEVDDELLRIDLYTASTKEDAKKIVRNFKPNIIFIPPKLGHDDCLDIYNDLSGTSNFKVVLESSVPDISVINHILATGELMDVVDLNGLSTYDSFKDKILEVLRVFEKKIQSENRIQRISNLSNALNIQDNAAKKSKEFSNLICPQILKLYDINVVEKQATMLASLLYHPYLSIQDYENLLSTDDEDILDVLRQANEKDQAPTSPSGFVIKFCHIFAQEVAIGKKYEDIIQILKNRPEAIRHPSIRAVSDTIVRQIFSSILPQIARKEA
jgi:hypothetical protein